MWFGYTLHTLGIPNMVHLTHPGIPNMVHLTHPGIYHCSQPFRYPGLYHCSQPLRYPGLNLVYSPSTPGFKPGLLSSTPGFNLCSALRYPGYSPGMPLTTRVIAQGCLSPPGYTLGPLVGVPLP